MAKKKNTMEIDLYSQPDGHEMSKKEYSEFLIKQNYERKLDNAYNLPWSFNNTLKDTNLDDISGVRECFDENRYLSENLTVKKAIEEGLVDSAWDHWIEFGRIQRRFAKFNLPFEVMNNNNLNQDLYIIINRNSVANLPKELLNILISQTTLGFDTIDLVNPFNYLLVTNLRDQLINAKLAPSTTSVIYLKSILDSATSLNSMTLRHINLNYNNIFNNRGLPHYLVEPHSPLYGENIVYASMHLSVVMGSKRIILVGDLNKENDETIFLNKIISNIRQHNIHVISTDQNSSFSEAGATYISLYNLLEKSTPQKKIVKESYIINDGYNLEHNDFFVSKASGSHLYDSNGIKYIDTAMAAGSALLGHAHGGLKETISSALNEGSLFCKPTTSGIILGNSLKNIFPWFSGFALCNTGSEATMRLIRIARSHSQKNKIALFAGSWHGTHDFLLVDDNGSNKPDKPEAFLRSAGSPKELLDLIILLPYNSDEAFDKIQKHKDEIAVVITEPIQGSNPKESDVKFMRDLRKVTQESNVLLAFDEIITGGRLGIGGFQKRYGILGDLASYGKIFGGGLPFGFVGGTTKIMENIFDPASRGRHISENKPLIMGGTFTGNPLTLSGCNYLLDHLRENEEEIYTYIDRLSMNMRDSINQFCEEEKIAVRMSGIGSINRLIFSDQEIISARHRDEVETPPKIQSKIYAELLAKKIHVAGNRLIFLSTAHTPEEVSFIIDEIKRTLLEFKQGRVI